MKFFRLVIILLIISVANTYSQKVGFVNSETIRDNFPEAKQAEQRIQSMVDEWKRELASIQQQIEDLEFNINKNRLVWSDSERIQNEEKLKELKERRLTFARAKFEPNGEYDKISKEIMQPIEEKIFAAIQQVSADEKYDIIWDQSIQPLAYVNFKYDITVSVLRKLGVDVKKLEEDLQQKIQKDPRNKKRKSKSPRRRRTSRNDPNKEKEEKTIERNEPENPEGKPPENPEEPPEEIEAPQNPERR